MLLSHDVDLSTDKTWTIRERERERKGRGREIEKRGTVVRARKAKKLITATKVKSGKNGELLRESKGLTLKPISNMLKTE